MEDISVITSGEYIQIGEERGALMAVTKLVSFSVNQNVPRPIVEPVTSLSGLSMPLLPWRPLPKPLSTATE